MIRNVVMFKCTPQCTHINSHSSMMMRRPSLCTWKIIFILFLTVESHCMMLLQGISTLWHDTAHYYCNSLWAAYIWMSHLPKQSKGYGYINWEPCTP